MATEEQDDLKLDYVVGCEFPFPIAIAYRRFRNEFDPHRLVYLLRDLFESTLFYVSSIAITCYLSEARRDSVLDERLHTMLRRPALGHWLEALRETLRFFEGAPERHFMPELYHLYFPGRGPEPFAARSFEELVEFRNSLVHGGTPGNQECREAVRFHRPTLRRLLLSLRFLARFPLLFVGRVQYREGAFAHEVRVGMGDWTEFETARYHWREALEPGRAYVLSPTGGEALRLFPFVASLACDCGLEHTVFFHSLEGGQAVRFASCAEGHQFARESIALDDGGEPLWLSREFDSLFEGVRTAPLRMGLTSAGGTVSFSEPVGREGALLKGKYRLTRRLKSGGMGEVYLATQESLSREVAVKILPPQFARRRETVHRFHREARYFALFDHPNIVRIFDSDEDGGEHFIVMEYVRGRDLRDRLQAEGRLPVDETIRLVHEIARGLEFIHQNEIIHRDLKPANILLAEDGGVKICDFGVARSLETAVLTETGMMVGTPGYMSPEQVAGHAGITPASDIYALGAVVYEMLTGSPPFAAAEPLSVMNKHVHERPAPPSRLVPALTPGIDAAILKALEKDPARRFASAGEFARALENHARVPPPVEVVHGFARVGQLLGRLGCWRTTLPAMRGLAVDRGGDVYVVDGTTALVRRYSPAGELLAQWGSHGRGPGQFVDPWAIAVAPDQTVLVASNQSIQRFTNAGELLATVTKDSSGEKIFRCRGLAIDSSGHLYLVQEYDPRVVKLSPDGRTVAIWYVPGAVSKLLGIAADSEGHVYVADWEAGVVSKYTVEGDHVVSFGSDVEGWRPCHLTFEGEGSVWATDMKGQRVLRFSEEGQLVSDIGGLGVAEPGFDSPTGIACGPGGRLYVADSGTGRIQVFGTEVATTPFAPRAARVGISAGTVMMRGQRAVHSAIGEALAAEGCHLVGGGGGGVDSILCAAEARLEREAGSRAGSVRRVPAEDTQMAGGRGILAARMDAFGRVLDQVDVVIHVAGSTGVEEEHALARSRGLPTIPVGSVTGSSCEVWNHMRGRVAEEYGGLVAVEEFEDLGRSDIPPEAMGRLVARLAIRLAESRALRR